MRGAPSLIQRRSLLISGIAALIGMNMMYGRNISTVYLSRVQEAPIHDDANATIGKSKIPGPRLTNIPHYENAVSPACKPHFQVVNRPMQPLQWSNFSKFKRFYFYHARKAGGTSLKYYMEKVAKHHGIKFASAEFEGSEVPGSSNEPTFYVTHLREPVARSISHFKYEGRWDCKQLTTNMTAYKPSDENANKLENWTGDIPCKETRDKSFFLVKCAANCYSQWFSSLSCPSWNIPIDTQVKKAKAVLHRFNFIVILEKLKDPKYVSAVEDFFGVPGLSETKSAWCESQSHQVNTKFPLEVKAATLQSLTEANQVDIDIYNDISRCLSEEYDFPKWNGDRFESNNTSRIHYNDFAQWKKGEVKKNREKLSLKQTQSKAAESDNTTARQSPACKPHFDLATNVGWSNTTRFKRLYFYHSRKAGGSSLRYYLEKVARHHGLEYAVTEYEMAEDPGSNDESTFYVTNIRDPVSRSISGFKYEGRWECQQMVYNFSFVPTEDNANKIGSWRYTGGHDPMKCKFKHRDKPLLFFLGRCAFNCFIQWFAGKCPEDNIPWPQQYEIAKEKLLRYNIIIALEKMKDPNYVAALEKYFGVPGITQKKSSLCEPEADSANRDNPLTIPNETLKTLKDLNALDIKLYNSLTDCLENGEYNFPRWNGGRFHTNTTIQVHYENFEQWSQEKRDASKANVHLANFKAANAQVKLV